MTEAKMQTKFTRWLRDNWDDGAGAFELKVGKGNVVAFSCVPEHQILSLMRVRGIERLGLVEGWFTSSVIRRLDFCLLIALRWLIVKRI